MIVFKFLRKILLMFYLFIQIIINNYKCLLFYYEQF